MKIILNIEREGYYSRGLKLTPNKAYAHFKYSQILHFWFDVKLQKYLSSE